MYALINNAFIYPLWIRKHVRWLHKLGLKIGQSSIKKIRIFIHFRRDDHTPSGVAPSCSTTQAAMTFANFNQERSAASVAGELWRTSVKKRLEKSKGKTPKPGIFLDFSASLSLWKRNDQWNQIYHEKIFRTKIILESERGEKYAINMF